jgi:hypothetical protein
MGRGRGEFKGRGRDESDPAGGDGELGKLEDGQTRGPARVASRCLNWSLEALASCR